jgi:protein phosphatase 1L
VETDLEFVQSFPDECSVMGSTATICIVLGDRIITANLGDSKVVLSRQGQAIELTQDHKAVSFT